MEHNETIFSQIISKAIPADIVYEDDICLAFRDINPQAPQHILLIPKVIIPRLVDALPEHKVLLGHMLLVVGDIAKAQGISEAFRLVVNNGAGACQTVFHLHMHIMGGRDLSWPPG